MSVAVTEAPAAIGLSLDECRILADLKLSVGDQERLNTLLAQNKAGTLDAAGTRQLDEFLDRLDDLNVIKARAMAAVAKAEGHAA